MKRTSLFTRYPTTVWVRLFGELVTQLSLSMITPFLILYLNEQAGSSVPLTMLVIGLQPASEIALTLIAGGVTDRYGRKSVMLVALGLQALAMLGMAFAHSLAAFAILYMINGAGRSLFIPAARALLADTVPHKLQSEAFALLNTASYIGAAAGPLVGVLIYQSDPSLAFQLTAFSLVLYAACVWWKIPASAPEESSSARTPSPAFAGDLPAPAARHTIRPALHLMLLAMPISLFYAQTETNLQLHLKNTFTDYLELLAMLASTKAAASIFLEFWLVKWTQRVSPRILITGSYVCFAAVSAAYAQSDSAAVLLAIQLVLILGESVGLNHLLTLVARIAPPSMRGRYFAITGLHWDISRAAGPYLGSLVLIHFGGAWLFGASAVLLLIGALAQYLYLQRMEKASPSLREGSSM
ncbi:MAG: MFS transporter [Brevibacillus sp.]|jgi:MFS family permease|nr:MAG: MFS transporter [Brevibacillus sp.]